MSTGNSGQDIPLQVLGHLRRVEGFSYYDRERSNGHLKVGSIMCVVLIVTSCNDQCLSPCSFKLRFISFSCSSIRLTLCSHVEKVNWLIWPLVSNAEVYDERSMTLLLKCINWRSK